MISMSLPHFSEESGSSYILRKHHHKRDEDGYLFTSAHTRIVFAFAMTRKVVSAGGERGSRNCAKWGCMVSVSMSGWVHAAEDT